MSIDHSIAQLMDRLADWSRFPKYSLERRVDIFLTPFVEGFIGRALGGEAELVAPEFPLLANLREESPPAPGSAGWTAHTVNVDYLLHLVRKDGRRSWVLAELKTDGGSYRTKQDLIYRKAIDLPMSTLREHIELVRKHTKHRRKYVHLQSALAKHDPAPEGIELVYLGPEPRRKRPAPQHPRIKIITLDTLIDEPIESIPVEHRTLWLHVCSLLRRIARKPGVRARATLGA